MKYTSQNHNLPIELDTKDCELSAGEIREMERDLDVLREVVEAFPTSSLYITVIYHPRHENYHVKTTLALPGRRLFTGERDGRVLTSFQRCVRKLVRKVAAYKDRMRREPELAKQEEGTHQAVVSTGEIDVQLLERAVRKGHYSDFCEALDVFTAPLTDRIGRWIQRYPALESHLGADITISDIVEEVFLTAFDRFRDRPHDVPAGDWLESLIDPAVHALIAAPEDELANISFVQSMREAESHLGEKA